MAFQFTPKSLEAEIKEIKKIRENAGATHPLALSDVFLVRRIFSGPSSIRATRALLAPGIPAPCRFLLSIPDIAAPLLDDMLRSSGGITYSLKREYGDSFVLSREGIERTLLLLGEDKGSEYLSHLLLPVPLAGGTAQ